MNVLIKFRSKLANAESRSIVRFFCVVFPLNFGGFGLQFLTAIILARLMEVSEYGSYVYAFTLATVLALFVGSGLDQLALREIPKLLIGDNKRELFGFCGNLLINLLSQSLGVFFVFYLLIYTEFLSFNVSFVLVLLVALFLGLSNVVVGALQSVGFVVFPQVCIRLLQPLILFISIIIYNSFFANITPSIVLKFYVCISGLTVALLSSKLVLHLTPRLNGSKIIIRNSIPMFWTGISVAFVGVSYVLNTNIDTLMINWYLGDEEVGLYRIANRGALVVGVCLIVMNQVLYPVLSKQLASSDTRNVQQLINIATMLLFVFGSISFAIMYLGVDYFIALFGDQYEGSRLSLRILLLGAWFDVFLGVVGPILFLHNKERLLITANVVGIGINITLNSILLPVIGVEGAAVATVVALLIARILLVFFVHRNTKFKILSYS